MKALTLWQPWATLVAIGKKKLETRNWSTKHRGPLVIHAAKKPLYKTADMHPTLFTDAYGHKIEDEDFPLGAVIAIVDLVDVKPIVPDANKFISMAEYHMGNFNTVYEPRFMWVLRNPRLLPEPIPARGYQGIWRWNPTTEIILGKDVL